MAAPLRVGGYLRTHSGLRFYPWDPRPSEVDITDVAHALSQLCRFGGHSKSFYSVAQHCVLVSEVAAWGDQEYALPGLLHDAAEAYLLDLPSPIKHEPDLEPYRAAESLVDGAVGRAFAVDPALFHGPVVKHADRVVLATELRDLMHGELIDAQPLPDTIVPWGPDEAKEKWMNRFLEVSGWTR